MAKDKAAQGLQAGLEALSRAAKANLARMEAQRKADADRRAHLEKYCGCGRPKPCSARPAH